MERWRLRYLIDPNIGAKKAINPINNRAHLLRSRLHIYDGEWQVYLNDLFVFQPLV